MNRQTAGVGVEPWMLLSGGAPLDLPKDRGGFSLAGSSQSRKTPSPSSRSAGFT
jgi:hypothetical protein